MNFHCVFGCVYTAGTQLTVTGIKAFLGSKKPTCCLPSRVNSTTRWEFRLLMLFKASRVDTASCSLLPSSDSYLYFMTATISQWEVFCDSCQGFRGCNCWINLADESGGRERLHFKPGLWNRYFTLSGHATGESSQDLFIKMKRKKTSYPLSLVKNRIQQAATAQWTQSVNG